MKILGDMQQKRMLESTKNGILSKFPLLGATMSNLTFEPSTAINTAATDGEKVWYNEKFVEGLSSDEKVFVFSHEIMHIAFDHIMRSEGKDHNLWNIATDAVINQMLKAENLPLVKGGVDIEEALNKSAEEMYEKLKQEKEQQQGGQGQNSKDGESDNSQGQNGEDGDGNPQDSKDGESDNSQSQNGEDGDGNPQDAKDGESDNSQSQNGSGSDKNSQGGRGENQQAGIGQHDIWEDAVKKAKQKQKEGGKGQSKQSQGNKDSLDGQNNDIEKKFTQANGDLKKQIGERIRENLRKQKEQKQGSGKGGSGESTYQFGNVGNSRAAISWKKILKRELEKEEDRWSYRRADEDNDYQARIGTLEVEDHPETEVMLDTSGSIDEDLLKGFLRQLKPLLKESVIKVGFFASEATKQFQEVKSAKDIDRLKITSPGYGTNMDSAVRAFSKSKRVNKIVFTDGWADDLDMPKEDLKKVNVLWLVFGNEEFKPCCGKVIFIKKSELYRFTEAEEEDERCF